MSLGSWATVQFHQAKGCRYDDHSNKVSLTNPCIAPCMDTRCSSPTNARLWLQVWAWDFDPTEWNCPITQSTCQCTPTTTTPAPTTVPLVANRVVSTADHISPRFRPPPPSNTLHV